MDSGTCGSKRTADEPSSLFQGLQKHAKEFYEASPEQHKQ